MPQTSTPRFVFLQLLTENRPQAMAWVKGGPSNPGLSGLVKFYDTPHGGILVEAEVFGLPDILIRNSSAYYGMHIHQNGDCSADFTKTGDHYNPQDLPHPEHAGDLMPLLGNQGYAWGVFYDKRFQTEEILGRSIVIHSDRDDFTSQPSGNSGQKIACGVIRRME